ncbi:hypothetical protein BDY17DRAFT_313622 [Neohortaea acidophila]|uniref:Phosphatidate phosphatase APP1 catalytic domain-containing protein n=1 Tax=Neohortaea acidophila TaxID=245834 RepID=A0A6A6PH29_9PEZI|nr:uncharacterized protein BDY17DRAFT_313622 [Neohortaea acidophila]KAF2479024.1 hypothetical protein BDY17DRAFT_313622 [Neohortaea acidophila]
MASVGPGGAYDLSWLQGGSEPGTRRKKIAGYLKAANELRQSYMSGDDGASGSKGLHDEYGAEGPGPFEDASIVRSGNEEMILFPSYARRHVKRKHQAPPASGDVNDQEYWRREWERQEDDKAIVDVDVRGWIYTPHKGPLNRKQRLTLGVARQIAGLPAPTSSKPGELSQASSRTSSPGFAWKQEEDLIALEAEKIERRGEHEQRYARRGAFSETPKKDNDGDSIYTTRSGASSRNPSPDRGRHRLSQISLASSVDDDATTPVPPPHHQSSWTDPAKMAGSELATAHSRLLNRFKPFLANPLINAPVKAFFFNTTTSRELTVYTNPSGHFTCRAALDFIPTHVRVLAAERLSATEEVHIISPTGVSLISDIDDTVKHSGVSTNAREIFRNTFIRELSDLTIDGVREWYNTLHDMGVSIHYVSNSPWQLYPVLTTYFKMAHLPKGSFHLKQYSGMLQGIFEPVAERKKSSLQKIIHDFPERKFVLVGDSGEADLEVYTDIAMENPGRVLGIFIRDVTTTVKTGYFDPSNGPSGASPYGRPKARRTNTDGLTTSKRLSRPLDAQDDDAELRAAIAASLADMETEALHARQSINPDSPSPENLATPRPHLPPRRSTVRMVGPASTQSDTEDDLIDFSDEQAQSHAWLTPPPSNFAATPAKLDGSAQYKPSPSPPPKPRNLRSPSPTAEPVKVAADTSNKTPPPRPRKPSSAVKPPPHLIAQASPPPPPPPPRRAQTLSTNTQHQPSPLSQVTLLSPETRDRPALPSRPKDAGTLSKGFFGSRANPPPPVPAKASADTGNGLRALSTVPTRPTENMGPLSSASTKVAPVPPPKRNNAANASPSTNNRKATNRASGAWSDASGGSLPGSPGEAGMNKKEYAWNQRWARAKSVLERNGVTLRTWRTGSDVADVCVRLVEQAFREMK